MGENTLALLQYLSSDESPLPSLASGYAKPTTVFYQVLSYFIVYSSKTAVTLYASLLSASFLLVKFTFAVAPAAGKRVPGFTSSHLKGTLVIIGSFIGALVGANVVAFVMDGVLGKPLSWFSQELSCVALYGPPAVAGMSAAFKARVVFDHVCLDPGALLVQLVLPRVDERTVFTSTLLLHNTLACGIQLLGVGSAALFFISGLPLTIAYLVDVIVSRKGGQVSLLSYAVGQFIPLVIGAQMVFALLDVFVPLVCTFRSSR